MGTLPAVPRKAARAQEWVHTAWVAFCDIYPPREACKPCPQPRNNLLCALESRSPRWGVVLLLGQAGLQGLCPPPPA